MKMLFSLFKQTPKPKPLRERDFKYCDMSLDYATGQLNWANRVIGYLANEENYAPGKWSFRHLELAEELIVKTQANIERIRQKAKN